MTFLRSESGSRHPRRRSRIVGLLLGTLVAGLVSVAPALGQTTAEPYAPPADQPAAIAPEQSTATPPADPGTTTPPGDTTGTPATDDPSAGSEPPPATDPSTAPAPDASPGPYTPPAGDGTATATPPPTAQPVIYIPVDVPAAGPDQPATGTPKTLVATVPVSTGPDAPVTAAPVITHDGTAGAGRVWAAPAVPVTPDTPVTPATTRRQTPPATPAAAPAHAVPAARVAGVTARELVGDVRTADRPALVVGASDPLRTSVARPEPPPAPRVVNLRHRTDQELGGPVIEITSPPFVPGGGHAGLLEILAGYAFPGATNPASGAILLLFPLALLAAALTPRLPRLHLRTIVAERGAGLAGFHAVALRPG